jgi:hypothetical protein
LGAEPQGSDFFFFFFFGESPLLAAAAASFASFLAFLLDFLSSAVSSC